MKYSFTCYGHKNITSRHKTTLEFTKDNGMGLEGDCIVGVKADFSLDSLKKIIKSLKSNNKITIIIETINKDYTKIIEKINAEINPKFNSDKDIVIRKSDFIDERTFAIKADKAACDLNKGLVEFLRNGSKIKISVEEE